MENKDIEIVLILREYLMREYDGLGKGANATYDQMPTKEVAALIENVIKEIDKILSGKVSFE